jgi:anti-sigma factor RsiW
MSLCESIDTLGMAYLDDELAVEERHELETHLTECASCRNELDAARADQSLIRGSLAAPRATDTMRMRLVRSLELADRDAARAERRRMSSWLLPGSAILAAAAAIAMFVGVGAHSTSPQNGGSIAKAVVHQQRRALPLEVQGPSTPQWLQKNFATVEMPLVSSVGSKLLGARLFPKGIDNHDAALLAYDVTVEGRRVVLSGIVINDIRAEEMPPGEEVQASDRTVHISESDGHTMVTYLDADHHGYMFICDELSTDALVKLVGRTGLVGPQ